MFSVWQALVVRWAGFQIYVDCWIKQHLYWHAVLANDRLQIIIVNNTIHNTDLLSQLSDSFVSLRILIFVLCGDDIYLIFNCSYLLSKMKNSNKSTFSRKRFSYKKGRVMNSAQYGDVLIVIGAGHARPPAPDAAPANTIDGYRFQSNFNLQWKLYFYFKNQLFFTILVEATTQAS